MAVARMFPWPIGAPCPQRGSSPAAAAGCPVKMARRKSANGRAPRLLATPAVQQRYAPLLPLLTSLLQRMDMAVDPHEALVMRNNVPRGPAIWRVCSAPPLLPHGVPSVTAVLRAVPPHNGVLI